MIADGRKKLPAVDKALMDWLSETYPDQLPRDLSTSEKQIWMMMGEQRVIRKLRDVYRTQQAEQHILL